VSWVLDEDHTWVGFTVQHLLVSTVRGRFTTFEAEVMIDADHVERSQVAAQIATASIDTGNPARDADVQSPDILDVARFPVIKFESTQVARIGVDNFWLRGLLTLHGVAREVVFSGRILWPLTDTSSAARAVLSLRAEIDRHDFELRANVLIGARIVITIDAELTKDSADAPRLATASPDRSRRDRGRAVHAVEPRSSD
jgi:polyisoprenoid-binding protein YceI